MIYIYRQCCRLANYMGRTRNMTDRELHQVCCLPWCNAATQRACAFGLGLGRRLQSTLAPWKDCGRGGEPNPNCPNEVLSKEPIAGQICAPHRHVTLCTRQFALSILRFRPGAAGDVTDSLLIADSRIPRIEATTQIACAFDRFRFWLRLWHSGLGLGLSAKG